MIGRKRSSAEKIDVLTVVLSSLFNLPSLCPRLFVCAADEELRKHNCEVSD